jgi:hypothetical protein
MLTNDQTFINCRHILRRKELELKRKKTKLSKYAKSSWPCLCSWGKQMHPTQLKVPPFKVVCWCVLFPAKPVVPSWHENPFCQDPKQKISRNWVRKELRQKNCKGNWCALTIWGWYWQHTHWITWQLGAVQR